MDKLQWFKFTPSDWIMGKIQRCPEVTQARFMRLCCIYWNKDCNMTYEDAEVEIDKEHLDILISKRVLKNTNGIISIIFLLEQIKEIEVDKIDKSQSGQIGNLKRWHRNLYDKFINNELTLNQAITQSKVSHPDSTPIDTQSQNIAEESKRREEEEKKREDKDKKIVFNFKKKLLELIDDNILVNDYLLLRKNKKASLSQTFFESLKSECENNKYPISEALKICIERNWVGFKYSWVENIEKQNKTIANGKPNTSTAKPLYRNSLQTAFNNNQQAEASGSERELSEDTEFEVID